MELIIQICVLSILVCFSLLVCTICVFTIMGIIKTNIDYFTFKKDKKAENVKKMWNKSNVLFAKKAQIIYNATLYFATRRIQKR